MCYKGCEALRLHRTVLLVVAFACGLFLISAAAQNQYSGNPMDNADRDLLVSQWYSYQASSYILLRSLRRDKTGGIGDVGINKIRFTPEQILNLQDKELKLVLESGDESNSSVLRSWMIEQTHAILLLRDLGWLAKEPSEFSMTDMIILQKQAFQKHLGQGK